MFISIILKYKTVTNSIVLLQVLERKRSYNFVLHILLCGGKTPIFIQTLISTIYLHYSHCDIRLYVKLSVLKPPLCSCN